MDTKTPIEYQIATNAGQASGGLEQVVSVLERMEQSITGIASSLSGFKEASDTASKAFSRIKHVNDRAFDTKRLVAFNQQMSHMQTIARKLKQAGGDSNLGIATSITAAVKEAKKLDNALNHTKPDSKAFKTTNDELNKQMALLSALEIEYNKYATSRADDIAPRVSASPLDAEVDELERAIKHIEGLIDTANQYDVQGRSETANVVRGLANQKIEQTLVGKADPQVVDYWKNQAKFEMPADMRNITPEMDGAADSAETLQARLEEISNLKLNTPEELAKAQKAMQRFENAAQTNRENIVKFTASGDDKSLQREKDKLAANEAAVRAYNAAIQSSQGAWDKLESGMDIKITNVDEFREAEQAMKKLQREVQNYSATVKRAKASGDAIGAEQARAKLTHAVDELERYKKAMADAASIKLDEANMAELESVYQKMDKLRSQISNKEIMGKNAFNSPALRKMKMDLTESERAALRLQITLGTMTGGEALAKNAKLTAKAFLQARIHAMMLNREAKKTNRNLINITRVLELMAVRMGVRAVFKDMNAGFVALADGFKPFNDSVSKLMDATTRVRNNLVSIFDPLVRVAAPAAANALDALSGRLDGVAQAIAAMTGNTTYQKLTSDAQDFAKANKEVKNSLAGFDKFNLIGNTNAGINGEKFKTTVETLPIEDKFLKWKYVGEGLREVFEGIADVTDELIDRLAELFGVADSEDKLKAVGEKLGEFGDWISENKEPIADLVELFIKLRLAIAALSLVMPVVSGISKLVRVGGTAAKGVGAIGSKIAGAAAAAKAGSAVAAPAGTLAASSVASTVASLMPTVATVVAAYEGYKYLKPQAIELSADMKEYAKRRTGEDKGTFESLGIVAKDAFTKLFTGYDPSAEWETNTNNIVTNTNAPVTTTYNTTALNGLDKTGMTDAVAAGVEQALLKNADSDKPIPVNVTVKAETDADRLFKLVVEKNNAQYNRTGRSPLKI